MIPNQETTMRNLKIFASIALMFVALSLAGMVAPAQAGTALWSPTQGDVFFPGLTPGAKNALGSPIVALPLQVDAGTRTATASSGAATLNKESGVITSEALTTAAGATYTLTLTDSAIAATDIVMASVNLGAGTGGTPTVASVKPGAGSLTIVIQNIHASAAFNAAIKIAFVDLK